MARVEATGVPTHRDQARSLLRGDDTDSVGEVVAEGDLDLDVLVRLEAGNRLIGMQLGRCGQHDGVDVVAPEDVGQIGGRVVDAVALGEHARRFEHAPDDRHDAGVVDPADGIQMLDAEGTRTGERHVDRHGERSVLDSASTR